VGGLATARALRSRVGPEHRIVVVDRDDQHRFAASLLWVLSGDRRPEQIQRPLARLGTRGIEFVQGAVTGIEPTTRTVSLGDGRTLTGDHLVLALGADLDRSTPAGLAEAGHCLYDADGAVSCRDALAKLDRGRVVVLTAAPAYKCPAAPDEAAMLIDGVLRRTGRRERVEVAVYAAEAAPMATAGKAIGEALVGMLASKGIAYHPDQAMASVEVARSSPSAADFGRLRFTSGAEAPFDLLAYVPVHRAPKAVVDAGLTNGSGWVPVDRATLATSHPGVWAIGDVTVIPLSIGRPLPKAGVFAHAEAEVVAANLARAITGRGEPRAFDGHGGCFVEVGQGRAAYGAGDFFAEPAPAVTLRAPAVWWHAGKVLFEKYWLWRHP
jgi:sulfide:quinone oxidoreductase